MKARLQNVVSGGLSRALRIAQLGAVRVAASAANSLHRQAKHLEVRLDGLDKGLDVEPITDIAWPSIDLTQCDDPILAVLSSTEFESATRFFADNPASQRSLVSADRRRRYSIPFCAIYAPITYSKSEVTKPGRRRHYAEPLHANSHGLVHTVDPFRADYITATVKHWPPELLKHVRIHSMSSMDFYMEMERQGIHPGVVFVDGNHDYEFALFDIGRAAKYMSHGGFIFVDNIAQPGPFLAARDFLAANPGWRELGGQTEKHNTPRSFDRARSAIPNTDFIVLQAPRSYVVNDRPTTFGRMRWWSPAVNGLELQLHEPAATGFLDIQVVLRGFGSQPVEAIGETTIRLEAALGAISVPLQIKVQGQFTYFSVETWLIWRGDRPLYLTVPPKPCC